MADRHAQSVDPKTLLTNGAYSSGGGAEPEPVGHHRAEPGAGSAAKGAGASSGQVIEDERLFRWWDYLLFGVLTLVNATAIVLFSVYWFSLEGWASSILLWIATLLLFRNLCVHQLRWFSLLLMKKPKPLPAREGRKVAVVTTFVPGLESVKMLEQTIRALVTMEYPHDTWVLDEGDAEEVKALCEQLGARHFSRKGLPHYCTEEGTFQRCSKHGNYNAWLYEIGFADYEIIAAFDPDHVPVPDYLLNVLGYFDDPAVGYVQVPQVYYNQQASFIARGAAEETYAYYSIMQMAYYALGHPVVTGCHNVHRVTALKEVGGFAAHDADDLLITLFYRAAGWRGIYVPKILAKGLTPVDWSAYLKQQLRWARSVLDVKLRAFPKLIGKLSFADRLVGLLHGIYYLQGLTAFFAVALLIFMLVTSIIPSFVTFQALTYLLLLYLVLKVSEFYKHRFFLDWRSEWGVHWRAGLLQIAKWPYLLLAFVDVLLGRKKPYSLTPKVGGPSKHYALIWPHLIITVLVVLAWAIGMFTGGTLPPVLHIWAALVVCGSVALMWTETWDYPGPFDKNLRPIPSCSANHHKLA